MREFASGISTESSLMRSSFGGLWLLNVKDKEKDLVEFNT